GLERMTEPRPARGFRVSGVRAPARADLSRSISLDIGSATPILLFVDAATDAMIRIADRLTRLRKLGYTANRITVQGRTITITCASSAAAERWAGVLGPMARASGGKATPPVEVSQPAARNRSGLAQRPTLVRVWVTGLTFA